MKPKLIDTDSVRAIDNSLWSLSRSRASITARAPSQAFIALTSNPELTPPARFEPTEKREGDIVL